MEKESQNFKVQNKHIISLASIMLLAPITYFMVKNNERDIQENEKNFIFGYIKYGLIIDLIVFLAFGLGIFNYLYQIPFADIVIKILGTVGLTMIIIGVFLIFSEKQVFGGNNINIEYKKIKKGNIDLLINYLPIYNFFLWYNIKPTTQSFWWIKESIIFCSFWILLNFIFFSISLNLIIIILYIFRVISLIGGIDLISDKYKEKINSIFEKNPEEIFGYIKGTTIFLWDKLQNPGKQLKYDPMTYIQKYKREYMSLTNFKDKNIIAEYIIFIIFLFVYIENMNIIYLIDFEIFGFVYLIPIVLIVGRYVIMIPQNKLPYIPIIHEIVTLAKRLRNFLK